MLLHWVYDQPGAEAVHAKFHVAFSPSKGSRPQLPTTLRPAVMLVVVVHLWLS